MVAFPLVPIVIGGAIRLATPHVAKFLVKHGFKKASQTAVKGKTKIPKVSSKQAKDIVNKDQQTSFSLSKDISKKDIQKIKDRLGTSDKPSKSLASKQKRIKAELANRKLANQKINYKYRATELKKQIEELRKRTVQLKEQGKVNPRLLDDALKKLGRLEEEADKLGGKEKRLKAKKSEIERKEKKTADDKESDLRKFIRREEIRQRREEDLVRWRAELKDRYKIDTSDWSDARIKDMGSRLELRKQGLPSELPELGIEAEKILLKRQRRQPHQKAKTKAKELTDDPSLQKFLESGPREFKKGGRIGRPKGVGKALRGYGRAMKRGK